MKSAPLVGLKKYLIKEIVPTAPVLKSEHDIYCVLNSIDNRTKYTSYRKSFLKTSTGTK